VGKLAVGFLILSVIFCFIDAIAAGGGGLVATRLDGALNSTDTTVDVDSTDYFVETGVLIIGNEKLSYAATTATSFTGCTRGFEDTTAASHVDNTIVYSEDIGIMNYALNYDIASVVSTSGVLSVVVIPIKFFTVTIPKIAMWDYGFLSGQMIYLRYILQIFTIGFILAWALQGLSVAQGIFKK